MIDIAVVLNGDIKDETGIADLLKHTHYIIAVDGGLNHLRKLNCKPDLIIGDLDSVDSESLNWSKEQNIPCLKYPPEKDMTDSELALQYCKKLQAEGKLVELKPDMDQKLKIGLLAAFGSRIDHVFANQFLAQNYADQFDFLLTDGEQTQFILHNDTDQLRSIILNDHDFYKFQSQTTAFTVLSMSDSTENVSIQNAKYPLQNYSFKKGVSRGVSNEPIHRVHSTSTDVHISFGKGCLSIFVVPKE